MKTIGDCIKESEEFLPSLKALVTKALKEGEDENKIFLVYVDTDSDGQTIASSINDAYNELVDGDTERLIFSSGHTLGDLQTLTD